MIGIGVSAVLLCRITRNLRPESGDEFIAHFVRDFFHHTRTKFPQAPGYGDLRGVAHFRLMLTERRDGQRTRCTQPARFAAFFTLGPVGGVLGRPLFCGGNS